VCLRQIVELSAAQSLTSALAYGHERLLIGNAAFHPPETDARRSANDANGAV
jgi:hypothetical protein